MKALLYCRRTFLAAVAMAVVSVYGFLEHFDGAMYVVAAVAVGIGFTNAYENTRRDAKYKG